METDQLDTAINSKEDRWYRCECTDLYKHDVEDGPMGHVSAVLTRQECQVSMNRMVPLKEKAMLQQIYGTGPYCHIYSQKDQRGCYNCPKPPQPGIWWSLLLW